MAPSGSNCAKRKSGQVSSFEAFSRIPGLLNSFDGHESPSCMKLNNTYNLSFNFSTNNYGRQYWNYFFSLFRYKLVLFEFGRICCAATNWKEAGEFWWKPVE